MIKAIIFDFDGVIIESADIKTNAFRKLFSGFPEHIEEIVDYHKSNMGISRYVKFEYIYKEILGLAYSKSREKALAKRFSEIVLREIIRAPFVDGALEFLSHHKNKYRFFIASGTPENELNHIADRRSLRSYFHEINGSPRKKDKIITDIMSKYNYNKHEVVFVGDSLTEESVAGQMGICFIGRCRSATSKLFKHCLTINDLNGLNHALERLRIKVRKS